MSAELAADDTVALAHDALARLDTLELAAAVAAAVRDRAGAMSAARVQVLLSLTLDEAAAVGRLSGAPSSVVTDLEADQHRSLLIRSAAHRAILDEPLMESVAVAQALGRGTTRNGREAASSLRRESRLIGLPQGTRRFLYPSFQLDLRAQRVHPVVETVNRALDAVRDPWGVASWWISATPRLRGAAPRDLIGTEREPDLLVLARAGATEA